MPSESQTIERFASIEIIDPNIDDHRTIGIDTVAMEGAHAVDQHPS